jgi:RNA polymerase sigma-70 factor, ECF subfamily
VCRRVTGSDADAADAAQEAMIAIVRGLPNFDGRSSFGTWAYRIAVNTSLDELRRRRRRPQVGLDRSDDEHASHEVVDASAHRRIDVVADRLELDTALRALPPDFRVPVVLRDVADLDYAEIAAILDVPLGTVKSRIARGRAALAGLITLDGNHDDVTERPSTES